MTSVLSIIYSPVFLAGTIFGAILMRLIQHAQCRWKNAHRPLPNGVRRTVPGIDPKWIGAVMAVGTLGYVLFQGQQTHDQTVALSDATKACQVEFNTALRARSQITIENDKISRQQREVVYDWMHQLIFPPPDIAVLPGSDPRREKYALDLTLRTDDLLRASIAEQREIDQRRADNPYPEPSCGK